MVGLPHCWSRQARRNAMLKGCMPRYAACCIALVFLTLPSHLLAAAMSPDSIETHVSIGVGGGLADLIGAGGATTLVTNGGGTTRLTAVDPAFADCTAHCSITPPSAPVCPGRTAEVCANPDSADYGYLWSTGERERCITVGSGDYTVIVTNPAGCSDTCRVTVEELTQPV